MQFKIHPMLKNKRVLLGLLIVLGIIVFALMLYYFGPDSFWGKAAWVLGLAAIGGAVYALKWMRAWRAGNAFFGAMSAQPTDEHQLEVSALQEKMKEAISKLKASGVHSGYRGAAALYALPWYMIIGPSAAGKSTLLRNSDLNFPFSANDQIDIKGFAGTRNCDWWFADEAIILDTAGRYTMEETDKPEWLAFLQLLRRHRRRSPLNGVIVALSLEDIIGSNKQSLDQHMSLIRQKLDELNQQLGIIIPVHLVVTKCDLIEGFSTFFKDLSQSSREQAWGARLQGDDFAMSLTGLVDKLSDWRIQKLPMHPELKDKFEILAFPESFEQTVEKVRVFLESLTQKNHFQEQPDFKGVYFTSALQEGEKAEKTGVRAYFIKDLFRKIIFQQRQTNRNAYQERLVKRLKISGAIGAVAVSILALVMLHSGYQLQKELYAYEKLVLTEQSKDPLVRLMKVSQHYASLKDIEEQRYWRFMLGLNSLEDQLAKTEELFAAYFSKYIIPDTVGALEASLDDYTKKWGRLDPSAKAKHYALYYDKLKAYLMLFNDDQMDPEFVSRVMSDAWQQYLDDTHPVVPLSLRATNIQPLFLSYYEFLNKNRTNLNGPSIDRKRVQAARNALYMSPQPRDLYQHLLSRGQQELGLASVQDLMSGKDQGLLQNNYPMPRMYTRAAFETTVLPMMKTIVKNAGSGDWVLQDNAEGAFNKRAQEQWVQELRTLYFNDYEKHWISWLSSMKIKSFYSLDDAASKLGRLKSEKGPIVAVMKTVQDNTQFGAPELNVFYESIKPIASPGNKLLDQYLTQVGTLESELSGLGSSSDQFRDAETFARKILVDNAETSLSTSLQSLTTLLDLGHEPKMAVMSFLRSPIEASWEAILHAASQNIQRKWEAQVLQSYNHALRGKFPFAKTHIEVALDDLTTFFNPKDGVINQFYEESLAHYLKRSKNGWVEQKWLGLGMGFTDHFLNVLSQSKDISYAMFRPGSADPRFTFYVRPIALPGIEEVIFDSNGQQYRYRNEPEEWRRFTWPGDGAQIGARLYASGDKHIRSGEIEYEGIWGLFHLLSDAKFVKQGGAHYITEFKVPDRAGRPLSVKIRMKADKQSNVLNPHILSEFKLPEQITAPVGTRG